MYEYVNCNALSIEVNIHLHENLHIMFTTMFILYENVSHIPANSTFK